MYISTMAHRFRNDDRMENKSVKLSSRCDIIQHRHVDTSVAVGNSSVGICQWAMMKAQCNIKYIHNKSKRTVLLLNLHPQNN